MLLLDGQVDLANLAMVLVLSSALASLWLPAWLSALAGAAAVMAFNWTFVPPRGAFTVDLHQHALLLGAMLVVNWDHRRADGRPASPGAPRRAPRDAAERLRAWGDTLRDAVDPLAQAGALHAALAEASDGPVALMVLKDHAPGARQADDDALGAARRRRRRRPAGRALAVPAPRPGHGPGHRPPRRTGRRGTCRCAGAASRCGAAVLRGARRPVAQRRPSCAPTRRPCATRWAWPCSARWPAATSQRAREQAQAQGVRNALLAAISHDYRTPLATILGAASSLHDQADRLAAEQRRRLAAAIVDEAERSSAA